MASPNDPAVPPPPPEAAARGGAFERVADGILLPVDRGWLKLQVRTDHAVRVAFAPQRGFFDRTSPMIVDGAALAKSAWTVETTADAVTLTTAALQVRVERRTGAVAFFTAAGTPITAERAGGRVLEPATVGGERVYHVAQQWEANADESLYGLGQQQLGVVDIKNYDLELWQHNGTVVIPFLVSSRGYGILWDNLSYSRFGDLRSFVPLPSERLHDREGLPGGVTATYFSGTDFAHEVARRRTADVSIELPAGDHAQRPNTAIDPALPEKGAIGVRWEGTFDAPVAGAYLFQTYSANGAKLWIDDQRVIANWWEGWLPYAQQARLVLTAGPHRLRAEWTRDQNAHVFQLRWKMPRPGRPTTLWSEVGDGIDYTFVYGPQLDRVIAGYRTVTGAAPMMPVWAFGLWQSRQRYQNEGETLDVLAQYRRRGIPLDNIVQDWLYWRTPEWGSHAFDPERFPQPERWIETIHRRYQARVMISVWGKFYAGTANFAAMRKHGYLYEPPLQADARDWLGFPFTMYDAFNPVARALYWTQVREALFAKGIDAWWLDASEPDLSSPPDLAVQEQWMNPTALGPGSRVLNAYALMNSRAVYEGQRAAAPDQRVFILTRSGFGGIQRYASSTWSGDVPSTWESLRHQIAAGLGFSISGVPYWSMDIGGYTAPPRFLAPTLAAAAQDEWCELNARWFEFGAFVPLVRLHGESRPREPWAFGGDAHPAFRAIVKFDRLRYRLLPYVYSEAGAVTHEGGTLMRPLVMDFPTDAAARDLNDEYLFGPALLVAPVTEYGARARPVYLPKTGGGWFNFWTGEPVAGGTTRSVAAPYDEIPLFARAGAIVPFGPERQYTTEKPADPLTLYVYAGADGAYTLYEDDGLTYGYERGACARIPLRWNEATHTLEIGARTGAFPGMLTHRTFQVVLVTARHPVGFSFDPKIDRTVRYAGAPAAVTFK